LNSLLQMSFKYTVNTLKKLEQLLEEAGYTLRYEKGNFNSGFCILEDRKIAIINKFLNIEGRINTIVDLVPLLSINEEELSGEILKFLKQIQQNNPDSTSIQTQIDL